MITDKDLKEEDLRLAESVIRTTPGLYLRSSWSEFWRENKEYLEEQYPDKSGYWKPYYKNIWKRWESGTFKITIYDF